MTDACSCKTIIVRKPVTKKIVITGGVDAASIAQIQEYVEEACTCAGTARGYSESASGSAESAQGFATAAQTAQGLAEAAQGAAERAQGLAEGARDDAVSAKADAVAAKDDAVQARADAISAKDDAVSARADAISAKDDAVTAQGLAESARDAAIAAADSVVASAAQIEQNRQDIAQIKVDLTIDEKNIENLLALAKGQLYSETVDSTDAYSKAVPAAAMTWASLDEVGGKTVAWNQLAPFAQGETIATKACPAGARMVSGHKYLYRVDYSANSGTLQVAVYTRISGTNTRITYFSSADYKKSAIITSGYSAVSDGQVNSEGGLWIYVASSSDPSLYATNVQLIDLTQMFGAGNEPSTVSEFEAMFPDAFYSYDSGTLKSAGVTQITAAGKNLVSVADASVTSQTVLASFALAAGTYTLSATVKNNTSISGYLSIRQGSTAKGTITIASGDSGVRKSVTVTLTDSDTYSLVGSGASSGYSFTVSDIQIERGSTATAYKPYRTPWTAATIPAEIQALPGWGWTAGSAKNYVDYERRVYVQEVAEADLGSFTYTKYTSGQKPLFYADVTDKANATDMICARYAFGGNYSNANGASSSAPDKSISGYSNTAGTNHWIYVIDSAYDNISPADFKTAVTGVKFHYQLATPIETDVSAYLSEDNLIEVEGGGSITFKSALGDSYRIPVRNAETFIIDLNA